MNPSNWVKVVTGQKYFKIKKGEGWSIAISISIKVRKGFQMVAFTNDLVCLVLVMLVMMLLREQSKNREIIQKMEQSRMLRK